MRASSHCPATYVGDHKVTLKETLDYLNYQGPLYLTRIENLPPEKEFKVWREEITRDITVEVTQAHKATHVEILDKTEAGCLHLLESEAIQVMRFLIKTYRPDYYLVPEDVIYIAELDLDNAPKERVELRRRVLERAKQIYEKYKDEL